MQSTYQYLKEKAETKTTDVEKIRILMVLTTVQSVLLVTCVMTM